ncbi:HAAS signaling domain-containing protein [Jiangella rhizosphaerae]|nr:hypothetical protein [Jiangella rhizosphaerae]
MEEPMLSATQHQRVDRYLAELAGALGGLPETERADVVAGIREHIEAALAGRSPVTDADVDEVLRALGDPLAIAAEATGADGVSGAAAGPAIGGRRDAPVLSRDWVPAFVVVALLAAPLLLTLLATVGGILLLPFAVLAGWAALWLSQLWTPLEKLAGTFLLPALSVLLFFGLFTSGASEVCSGGVREDGTTYESCTTEGGWLTPAVFWAILIGVAAASVATAVVLYRNGRRRAAELAQSFSTGA